MAVDDAYIEGISRGKYTVGSTATDAISSDTLSLFLKWANARLLRDRGSTSLTTDDTEQAVGLLVCHYIELDSSDKTGESINGYAYSRASRGTPWLMEYQDLLASVKAASVRAKMAARGGVTRCDADLGDLRFDRTENVIGGSL